MIRGSTLFEMMQPLVSASLGEARALGVLMLSVQGLRQFGRVVDCPPLLGL